MGSSLKGMVGSYLLMLTDPEKVSDLLGIAHKAGSLESRVYFRDGIANSDYEIRKLGRQWPPRHGCPGIKVYIYKTPSPTPEKIYFESLPENTTFTTQIILNGKENEIPLLVAAMGAKKYGVKLGRGKDRGFGIIKLKEITVSTLKGTQLGPNDINRILSEAEKKIKERWKYVGPAFFS